MPDATRPPRPMAPRDWGTAFAALPDEAPPRDGRQWLDTVLQARARVDARPGSTGTARRPAPPLRRWALAAALVLAVASPWLLRESPLLHPERTARPAVVDAGGAGRNGEGAHKALQPLYAESARLESLLAYARDDRVSSGAAAALASDLEARVAAIDVVLGQPGLEKAREVALWQERVQALRALVSFEGTRRWLAANGQRYDGTIVRVD